MANELDFFKGFMFRSENGDWFVKPVCDFWGLNYDNQVEKINNDKICQTDTGKFLSELVFGDKRVRLTLRNRGFTRWVQMTSTSNIRVELQEKFEIFQAKIWDYLWNGNIEKTNQLEDIRTYAININNAFAVRKQVLDYIGEQKHHRDFCLNASPADWAQIKNNLFEEKQLPEAPADMKAISAAIPTDLEGLKRMKKNLQTDICKASNLLRYQVEYSGKVENPMSEGYKRETVKLRIKRYESKIEEVNQKLLEIIQ